MVMVGANVSAPVVQMDEHKYQSIINVFLLLYLLYFQYYNHVETMYITRVHYRCLCLLNVWLYILVDICTDLEPMTPMLYIRYKC